MIGRPSIYSEEIAESICTGLMNGKSLRSLCLRDDLPSQQTVMVWLYKGEFHAEQYPEYADFRERYARAREVQGETLFDEMQDIADDGSNDYVEKEREDGSTYEAFNSEHVQRSKLRIETRKWMAGKLRPKKYGEKTLIGSDPENPLPNGFVVNLVKRDPQAD